MSSPKSQRPLPRRPSPTGVGLCLSDYGHDPDVRGCSARYRRPHFDEPGRRVVHPGIAGDIVPPGPEVVFGRPSDRGGASVSEVFRGGPATAYGDLKAEIREERLHRGVRRAPLGRSKGRGAGEDDRVHGVKTRSGRADGEAGEDENPWHYEDAPGRFEAETPEKAAPAIPVRPRSPLRRPAHSQLSENVQSVLHSLSDETESSKRSWRGACFYDRDPMRECRTDSEPCRASAVKEKVREMRRGAGVAEALSSRSDEKLSDRETLGKSSTPGFRNVFSELRTYGCPTIRTDIPKYQGFAMADHQNYGDDVDAKYLLRPNTYSSVGVDDDEVFKVHRSPEYLLKLFHAIGDTISEEDLARVYSKVEEENDGKVTIEAFRIAYYDYKHGFVTDESKCC